MHGNSELSSFFFFRLQRDGNGQRGTSVSENSPEISEHVLVSPHGSFSTVGGRTPSGLHGDRAAAPSISQGVDKQEIVVSDAEKLREHEAATKAQAAVRGYLVLHLFYMLFNLIVCQTLKLQRVLLAIPTYVFFGYSFECFLFAIDLWGSCVG